jgi:hypothetical protein
MANLTITTGQFAERSQGIGQGFLGRIRNRIQGAVLGIRLRGAEATAAFHEVMDETYADGPPIVRATRRVAGFLFVEGTGGGTALYEGPNFFAWQADRWEKVAEGLAAIEVRVTPDWVRWRKRGENDPEMLAVTNDRICVGKKQILIKVIPPEYRRDLVLLEEGL